MYGGSCSPSRLVMLYITVATGVILVSVGRGNGHFVLLKKLFVLVLDTIPPVVILGSLPQLSVGKSVAELGRPKFVCGD